MAYVVIPNISGTYPLLMMYGTDPILSINTLLQPRPKYVGSQLLIQE